MSAYDNPLFLWHDATGNLMGVLAMHGKDLFQKNVIAELKKIFKHMKVEHLNLGDWVLGKQKMDYYQPKFMFYLYPQ